MLRDSITHFMSAIKDIHYLLVQSSFLLSYHYLTGIHYEPENPHTDVLYALNQLQSLALETVIDNPKTVMSYEMVQQRYGCKLLNQVDVRGVY